MPPRQRPPRPPAALPCWVPHGGRHDEQPLRPWPSVSVSNGLVIFTPKDPGSPCQMLIGVYNHLKGGIECPQISMILLMVQKSGEPIEVGSSPLWLTRFTVYIPGGGLGFFSINRIYKYISGQISSRSHKPTWAPNFDSWCFGKWDAKVSGKSRLVKLGQKPC